MRVSCIAQEYVMQLKLRQATWPLHFPMNVTKNLNKIIFYIYLPQWEKSYDSSCLSSSSLVVFESPASFFSFDSSFSGPMVVTSLDFTDLVIKKQISTSFSNIQTTFSRRCGVISSMNRLEMKLFD